ncbi:ER membrane protein complex subunit 8 [Rhizoclosmatium sp. JEL0117]|nr:ER membrane protein complex subunit 8 [Rhizoclosmatium sp. JEL0117]
MVASTITPTAYAKVILHAAKFPSLSVFGVLLGSDSAHITDAVPIMHDFVALTSFLEAALEQTKIHAARTQTRIVGIYVANQLLEDVSVSPLAAKLGLEVDKLAGGNSVLLVIDNARLLEGQSELALLTFKETNGSWKSVANGITLTGDVYGTYKKLSKCIELNQQMSIYDFGNHLDDASRDWLRNPEVESAFEKA